MRWPPGEGELEEGLDTAANTQLPTGAGLKPLSRLWRCRKLSPAAGSQPPGANWLPSAENAAVMGGGLCPVSVWASRGEEPRPQLHLLLPVLLRGASKVSEQTKCCLYKGALVGSGTFPTAAETSDGGIVRRDIRQPFVGMQGRWRVGAFQMALWAGVGAWRQ